jgi:ATPase subunit of ABC transporter with duplicated ATPase domains
LSITHTASVVLDHIAFDWPDGTPVFRHLSAAFSTGRTGLIGPNGTGKSTLLKLIAGELVPASGSITATGTIGYLPQQLTLHTADTVADLLGVRERLDAFRAIESGDADPRHFDTLMDDWGIEDRIRAELEDFGLNTLDPDRPVSTLSGGETVLTAFAGLRLARNEVVLLDEPTNNLDRDARHQLYEAVATWRGTLIVVSHDVALLDLMDDTAELRAGCLSIFGGPYTAYRKHLKREQTAAEQALRTAEQKLKTEERQRIEAQTKLARRQRYARTDFENKRKPKVVMKQRKTEAQVSAGKLRGELDEKVATAREAVAERAGRVRHDRIISIDLPDPDVPPSRRLAELRDQERTIVIQGPERVALTGRNGIGKTRLLETITRDRPWPEGRAHALAQTDRIGYLPQRLDHLDEEASILDMVRKAAPHTLLNTIRANLDRLLFRTDTVDRRIGDLSGGERFRVALAMVLLTDPPNQLLILDEPTNSLDLDSIDELVDALDAYHGGLIIVSHDDAFLDRIGIDVWIELTAEGLSQTMKEN